MTAELDADSLTWRYFGDLRCSLLGMWVVALQNMYPALGAVVCEHSVMNREPLLRVARSMYPILGVVYDPHPDATGRAVRDYHRGMTAEPGWGGRVYHPLDPDTFYWAHTTFALQTVLTAQMFCGGLTDDQVEQLYAEHITWYKRYGMSMRPVPPTWEAFCLYWRKMCADTLEVNLATLDVLHMQLPKPSIVPRRLWGALCEPFLAGQRWIATACFPDVVRERAGLSWTVWDAILLWLYSRGVRAVFTLVPDRVRLHPRALHAIRRAPGPPPGPPRYFGPPRRP